ncbi:MAG: alpha/beta hydrolase [Alphaproteobacteria bacterium]|nr:alpha/beta hydrolase [Alphaproteobacteria bacterium]
MALDPVLKAFLDQMAAVPGPKMWESSPTEGRTAFAGLLDLVGPKGVPIGRSENVTAPGPAGPIPLRIYTPVAAGAEALPALVYFHGGGFVIGDLDTHDGICRLIANESGCRVVAVHYRLAPEHKYPAAPEDAFAATSWIAANASKLAIDANRIGVGGDSAGGALAATVAQMAKAQSTPKISFQLLMFPVTQIGSETSSLREYSVGYFLERKTLDWFYAHYLPDGVDPKADTRISPLRSSDFEGLPPAYIMLGGFDPLHDEGASYAQKLRDAGVQVTVADYREMVHCFVYLQTILPQAHDALIAAAAAVRKGLDRD